MDVLLALLPILTLIVLMGVFKVPGDRSSLITLIVTIVIAVWYFGQPLQQTGLSFFYGALKALVPILLIILMAIYSYNVLLHTGKIEVLKAQFSSISSNKCIQVLLITWGFGGLLEGMATAAPHPAIPSSSPPNPHVMSRPWPHLLEEMDENRALSTPIFPVCRRTW